MHRTGPPYATTWPPVSIMQRRTIPGLSLEKQAVQFIRQCGEVWCRALWVDGSYHRLVGVGEEMGWLLLLAETGEALCPPENRA